MCRTLDGTAPAHRVVVLESSSANRAREKDLDDEIAALELRVKAMRRALAHWITTRFGDAIGITRVFVNLRIPVG